MALHNKFLKDKFVILEPEIRWFPADEALREQGHEKLLPPFVPELKKPVGVAEYYLPKRLPKELKGQLPEPKQIEKLLLEI